jgi:hypothetical protein
MPVELEIATQVSNLEKNQRYKWKKELTTGIQIE